LKEEINKGEKLGEEQRPRETLKLKFTPVIHRKYSLFFDYSPK
jgi:hypothetical protein